MNSRIQVGIRLRPFLDSELSKGYQNSKIRIDKSSGKISIQSSHGSQSGATSTRVFEFDHIFEQPSLQEDIYTQTQVSSMITRVLDGFHSTIFAYGQTGSGKTFTMEGKHENGVYQSESMKGIVARSLDELFTQIAKLKSSTSKTYNVTCSFLQIYNEKIYDLLSAQPSAIASAAAANSTQSSFSQTQQPAGLKLRWNAREQFQVENLFVFDVKNPREAQSYFLAGVKNRITASHKLNMTSSRSHTIFTITVNTYTAEGAHETSSKLQLVDLAGSERIAQTGTEGKMAKESIDINKSLFTLRQVITALSEINQQSANSDPTDSANHKLQHIPYRESKLTSLLKQSIGGNCYCLMIACIVPNDSFVDENVSTLHYATRATYIRNQPIKNEDPNKQMLSEVLNENAALRNELDKANQHIAFMTSAIQKKDISAASNAVAAAQQAACKQCALLKQEIKQLRAILAQYEENNDETNNELNKQQQYQQQGNNSQDDKQQQQQQQQQFRRTVVHSQQLPSEDFDPSSTATAFVTAHQIETNRQVSQTMNHFSINKNFANPSQQQQQQQQQMRNTISKSLHHVVEEPDPVNPNQIPQQSQQQQQRMNQTMYSATPVAAGASTISRNTGFAPAGNSTSAPGEQENFNERLIESITLVRQLLESNKELRQQTDSTKLRMRGIEQELSDLTSENQKLVDQLQQSQQQQQYMNQTSINNTPFSQEKLKRKSTIDPMEIDDDETGEVSRINVISAASNKRQSSQSNVTTSTAASGPPEFKNSTRTDLIQEILDLRSIRKALEARVKSAAAATAAAATSSNNNDLEYTLPKLNSTGYSSNMRTTPLNTTSTSMSSAAAAAAAAAANQTGRSNYIFYSASKKRGNSQQHSAAASATAHHRMNSTATEDQIIGQQSSLNDVLMYTGKSGINGTQTSSFEHSNRTYTDSANAFYTRQQQQQQQQQNANPASAMDSVPTNFGRYTLYQQNFHGMEKMQQMSKLQSPNSNISENSVVRTPFASMKISDSKRQMNSTHSGYSSQDDEIPGPTLIANVHLHDIAVVSNSNQNNNFKRNNPGIPPYRSNSLNKQPSQQKNNHDHMNVFMQQNDGAVHETSFNRQRNENEKGKQFSRQHLNRPNQ